MQSQCKGDLAWSLFVKIVDVYFEVFISKNHIIAYISKIVVEIVF